MSADWDWLRIASVVYLSLIVVGDIWFWFHRDALVKKEGA